MIDASGPTFLFLDEADTLDAVAARIVPGDDGDPGAREMGVVTYIDRALAGAYAQYQSAYRAGIRALNAEAARANGVTFSALDADAQDAMLARLERGDVPSIDAAGGRDFFMMVWAHMIEGMFSDPAYGGNQDGRGWRLIGFPGAHYGYTAEEMRYGNDLTTKPMVTLADVRVLARERPDLFFHRPGSSTPTTAEAEPVMPPAETTGEAPVLYGAGTTDE